MTPKIRDTLRSFTKIRRVDRDSGDSRRMGGRCSIPCLPGSPLRLLAPVPQALIHTNAKSYCHDSSPMWVWVYGRVNNGEARRVSFGQQLGSQNLPAGSQGQNRRHSIPSPWGSAATPQLFLTPSARHVRWVPTCCVLPMQYGNF